MQLEKLAIGAAKTLGPEAENRTRAQLQRRRAERENTGTRDILSDAANIAAIAAFLIQCAELALLRTRDSSVKSRTLADELAKLPPLSDLSSRDRAKVIKAVVDEHAKLTRAKR